MDEKEVPTYYASGVSMSMTPWDISIRFMLREGDTAKDIRPVANVILSPQHALVLARILTKTVEQYQQQVGKIDLAPRILNDLGIEL